MFCAASGAIPKHSIAMSKYAWGVMRSLPLDRRRRAAQVSRDYRSIGILRLAELVVCFQFQTILQPIVTLSTVRGVYQ